MRLLAVWFLLLASGCSGKSPEREAWERQIDGVRTLLRLQNVQYVDMDWVATGRRDGTVVEQRDCPDGGEALLYEDYTVEFLDCIM
ncbi:MAG: hypothetical protein JRJ84_17660, partial [Deltaproteobacteria bacterium]|nr:hypothetical protein [Deltaproteobacteria bacterium]